MVISVALLPCHEAARVANGDFAELKLPSLLECAEQNLRLARMVNPDAELVGANFSGRLTDDAAPKALVDSSSLLKVPAVNPVRTGVQPIVDRLARAVCSTAVRA